MRTSIATVCLSGTLTQKMQACAAAGFDGVEVFEPDLVAAPQSPEEIRALADRLGLTLDLYQPFRDAEGVDPVTFAANLRRAEAKFALMQRLGMDTMLVCSNVGTATVDDDAVSAAQLRELGDLAATYGVRLAFEALAWGRFVDDYRRAWRIVELADHPNVGVCLDSFHILSRGHDPKAIEEIPGEKVFFLQLADAPLLSLDVLSWSRHHRLFPGEGGFDLAAFLAHVLRTGYDGPLSLEVFNDTFRQTDPDRTARAGTALAALAGGPGRPPPGQRGRPGASRGCPTSTEPTGLGLRRGQGRGHRRRRGRASSSSASRSAAGTAARRSGSGPRARHASCSTSSRPATSYPTWRPSASRWPTRASRRLDGPSGCSPRACPGGRTPARSGCAAFAAPDGTEVFLGRVPDGPDADLDRRVPPRHVRDRTGAGHPRRPRQPRAAVAALRRGGAVLQQRARPGSRRRRWTSPARSGWCGAR